MCDECKVLKAKLQETVAEAGVYRELLEDWREAYVRQGGIGYWDVLDRTRDALASDAGVKAAAVLAAAVLRAELKRISDLARQGDIVERGVLGDIADAALASGAGEKAAAVLEAGRRLLAARSWDVMGEEFLALKAAFDTLDADHG